MPTKQEIDAALEWITSVELERWKVQHRPDETESKKHPAEQSVREKIIQKMKGRHQGK